MELQTNPDPKNERNIIILGFIESPMIGVRNLVEIETTIIKVKHNTDSVYPIPLLIINGTNPIKITA